MDNEFPQLEYREYQDRFLKDWYSPRKLFKGERVSGKTTVMLCELDRFLRYDLDVAFIAPSHRQKRNALQNSPFKIDRDNFYAFSLQAVRNGKMRGRVLDAVIIDGFHEISFDVYNTEIQPMNPFFVRACCPKKVRNSQSYLNDEDGSGFFYSVYES